jgi:hypothetical protein
MSTLTRNPVDWCFIHVILSISQKQLPVEVQKVPDVAVVALIVGVFMPDVQELILTDPAHRARSQLPTLSYHR